MMVLALLVIAAGCGPQESAERAARDALQDEKVRAALAKPRGGGMGGMPAELKPEDSDTSKDANDDPDKETAASPKVSANQVLSDAIATAKTEDKALFVHFTADW